MTFYECSYCGKIYQREERFRVHYCEERKRHEILFTMDGRLGFALYETWRRRRLHGAIDHEMFKRSRTFKSFIRFAKFYRQINGLSDLDEFIDLMIKFNIQPCNWARDRVISFYLDHIDRKPPLERISRTVDSLMKLADAYDCPTDDLFNHLLFRDIVDFLKLGDISPWILLNSRMFHNWFKDLDEEKQIILEDMIDIDKWVSNFGKSPKYVDLSRECCKSLGI